ncbi:MAG: hypothetical protein ABIJ44_04360 [Pseudomonadota bacterium]
MKSSSGRGLRPDGVEPSRPFDQSTRIVCKGGSSFIQSLSKLTLRMVSITCRPICYFEERVPWGPLLGAGQSQALWNGMFYFLSIGKNISEHIAAKQDIALPSCLYGKVNDFLSRLPLTAVNFRRLAVFAGSIWMTERF